MKIESQKVNESKSKRLTHQLGFSERTKGSKGPKFEEQEDTEKSTLRWDKMKEKSTIVLMNE